MSNKESKNADEHRSLEANGLEVRPRNWLMAVILVTLREWDSYGYKLMEQAAALGCETVNPGTLYRTLRRMENEGLCESKWETTSKNGPARRVYSIPDAGNAYRELWAESLNRYQKTMDAF